MNSVARQQDEEGDRLVGHNDVVGREMADAVSEGGVVYRSAAIRAVVAQVHHVAPTNSTVLLLGETGVGKEVVAQAIHDASSRRDRRMIRVSCAAIPHTLIESELFGHERGAFTGAVARQTGRFEAAHGSSIFLEESCDVRGERQVKLLRVLLERTIERLGGSGSIDIDVRIIAATNRDLEDAVRNETFREDLFYRLNVFPITIPPLRARIGDIPALVWRFIDELAPRLGKTIKGISARSLAELEQYSWPGNVRELRNVIEREMILAKGPTLAPTVPSPRPSSGNVRRLRLVDVQAAHIRSVLDSCGWRIRGASGAAEQLGIKPTTLESRMVKLGIRKRPSAVMALTTEA